MDESPNVECAICANGFINGQNYAECPNHDIECEDCARTQTPREIEKLETKLANDTLRLEMVEQVAAAGDAGAGVFNDNPALLRRTIAETTKLLEDIRERGGLVCTFCLQRMDLKIMDPANLQRLKLVAVKNAREELRKLYADRGKTRDELEAEYERRGLQPHQQQPQQQQPQQQAMSLQISERNPNQGAAAAFYVPPGQRRDSEDETREAIEASLQTVRDDERRRQRLGYQGNGAAAVERERRQSDDAQTQAAILESLQTVQRDEMRRQGEQPLVDAELAEAIRMSMLPPAPAAVAAAARQRYVEPGVAAAAPAMQVQQVDAAAAELAEVVSRPMRQIAGDIQRQREQFSDAETIRKLLEIPATAADALLQQRYFNFVKSVNQKLAAAHAASADAAEKFARENERRFPHLAASAKQTAMDARLDSGIALSMANTMRPPAARWLPDDEATNCCSPECRSRFGLLNRKHHCRQCGNIFCSSCCTVKDGNRKCHNCFRMPDDGRPPAQDPSKRGGYKKSRKSKLPKMSRKSKLPKMSRKSKLSKMSRKSNLPKKSRKSKLSKMSRKK